jgi:PAS domain S-box-containing protein
MAVDPALRELARARAPWPTGATDAALELLDEVADMVATLGPDLAVHWCNLAFARRLGRCRDAIVGRSLDDLLPPDRARGVCAGLRRLTLAEPKRVSLDLVARPEGGCGFEEWTEIALFDAAGRLRAYRVVGRDVSMREEAAASANERSQRLRLALEAGRQLVWELDLANGELRCEAPPQGWLGWAAEELRWSPEQWLGSIHPDDVAAVRERHDRFASAPVAPRLVTELRLRRKDGSYGWVVCHTVSPMRAPDGRALRLAGIVADIDDRKRAEFGLLDRERRLEEREAWLSLALEAGQMSVWQRDLRNDTITFDSHTLAWFRRTGRSVPRRYADLIANLHPDDRAVAEASTRTLETGAADRYCFDARVAEPSGGYRWRQVQGSVRERGPDGRPITIVGTSSDITARKEAEARLVESERRLALALRAAGLGLWELDFAEQTIRFNEEMVRRAGFGSESLTLTRDQLLAIVHPDDRALVAEIEAGLRGGGGQSAIRAQFRLGRPDGSFYWTEILGSVVDRDEQGQVLRAIGVSADITARKTDKERLRHSEERARARLEELAALYDEAPIGLLLLDAGFGILRVNKCFAGMTGRPIEAHLGRQPWAWLPELEAVAEPHLRHVLATGEPVHDIGCELTLPAARAGAVARSWLLQFYPLEDASGRTVAVGVIVQDVTQRRQTELALRQAQAITTRALADLQANLDFIDRSIPGVLFRARGGPHGALVFDRVSASSAFYLGLSAEAVMRDGGLLLARVHPEDRATIWARIARSLRTMTTPLRAVQRVLGGDGRWRWMQATALPRRLANGELVWDGIVIDVTGIKDAEARSRELAAAAERARAIEAENKRLAEEGRAKAEAADRAKSAFLAMMSHEIRTPLTAVLGFADLLARSTALGEDERRQVRVIRDTGQVLLTILNDILDFSKLEVGKLDFECIGFALPALLGDALASTRLLGGEKGLAFTLDLAPDLPAVVHGDPVRLKQVLGNLLSNAVKFTERGTIGLRARVIGRRPGASLIRIEVEDTGIGIGEAQRQRLFREFEQADQSITRRFGGTGLGLAIARRLVQLMGGRLDVTSTPGAGSTFWLEVELLYAEPPSGTAGNAPSAAPLAPARAARLLVVDDVATNRQLVAAMLKALGHDAILASDGDEAVALAAGERFDLVLMDVNMPRLDGLSATRAIRAGHGPNAATPVVALTAKAFPEEIAACLDAGMTTHLAKPIDMARLQEVIVRALGREPSQA